VRLDECWVPIMMAMLIGNFVALAMVERKDDGSICCYFEMSMEGADGDVLDHYDLSQ